jgi:hypothetical protein
MWPAACSLGDEQKHSTALMTVGRSAAASTWARARSIVLTVGDGVRGGIAVCKHRPDEHSDVCAGAHVGAYLLECFGGGA